MINKYATIKFDAIQFKKETFEDIKEFTNGKAKNFRTERCMDGKSYCELETSEKVHIMVEGDYIIKNNKGDFFPCKQNIFDMIYPLLSNLEIAHNIIMDDTVSKEIEQFCSEDFFNHLMNITISPMSTYLKSPIGLIIQKIVYEVNNKNNELEIAFPIAFPNSLLRIVNLTPDFYYYIDKQTNTKIKLDIRDYKNQFIELLVIGF